MLAEIYTGGRSSEVKTALNNGTIKIGVFAVPALETMEEMEDECLRVGIPFVPWRYVRDDDTVDNLLAEAMHLGIEGWVLKDGPNWYKLKPVLSVDLAVTGFKPGHGKYRGTVGALICGNISVSGMDDETRRRISPGDLGRVCEVAYQYVTSLGKLRHPRFIRWRDDLPRMTSDGAETANGPLAIEVGQMTSDGAETADSYETIPDCH